MEENSLQRIDNEVKAIAPVEGGDKDRFYFLDSDFKLQVASEREKILADGFLKTGTVAGACRAYTEKYKKAASPVTVSRWLKRPRVERYIMGKMENEGYFTNYGGEEGKKRWLREMVEYREGKKKADKHTLYIMDLIAKYMGYKDESVTNAPKYQQINFYQKDGRE